MQSSWKSDKYRDPGWIQQIVVVPTDYSCTNSSFFLLIYRLIIQKSKINPEIKFFWHLYFSSGLRAANRIWEGKYLLGFTNKQIFFESLEFLGFGFSWIMIFQEFRRFQTKMQTQVFKKIGKYSQIHENYEKLMIDSWIPGKFFHELILIRIILSWNHELYPF